jgi:hypothetical protein
MAMAMTMATTTSNGNRATGPADETNDRENRR